MRVDTPAREMKAEIPRFDTCTSLARRAGVHRSVVVRLWSQDHLIPDAYIEEKGEWAPLFVPSQAIDVLRLQKSTRRIHQN